MDLRSVRTSLYRFIDRRSAEVGFSSLAILPGPSGAVKDRPLWVVEATPGGGVTRATKTMSYSHHRYAAFFLSKSFDEAELMIRHMERSLRRRDYRIPGVLVDYEYPEPTAYAVRSGEGSLSAGSIFIAVTGLGYLDDAETLPSEVLEVEVEAGDAVDIWIPRVPRVFNWFKKYNVYVGTSATALKKLAASPFDAEDETTVTTKVSIAEVPATGDAPPQMSLTNPSVVKYRFVRVLENALNYAVIPEPGNEANAWSAVINMVLETQDIAYRPQGRPIESVHMGSSVSGEDHDKYENTFD